MPKNTLRFISIYFRSVYYTMEAEFKNIIALLKKNKETKPVKTVIQKVTDVNSNVYDDNEDTQILEKNLEQKSKTKSENNFKQFPKPEEVPSENDDNDNVVAAAKVLVKYAKDNEILEIVGGSMDSTILDLSGVMALAMLPSLDELRGKLVGLLQAPAGKLASIVQAPAGQLARVFGAYGAQG